MEDDLGREIRRRAKPILSDFREEVFFSSRVFHPKRGIFFLCVLLRWPPAKITMKTTTTTWQPKGDFYSHGGVFSKDNASREEYCAGYKKKEKTERGKTVRLSSAKITMFACCSNSVIIPSLCCTYISYIMLDQAININIVSIDTLKSLSLFLHLSITPQ